MKMAAVAADKLDGKQGENLLDCWDAFMEHKLDKLVKDGKDWIGTMIKDMKKYWVRENFEGNDGFMHQICKAVHEQLGLLESKVNDAVQRDHFKLEDYGNQMDVD